MIRGVLPAREGVQDAAKGQHGTRIDIERFESEGFNLELNGGIWRVFRLFPIISGHRVFQQNILDFEVKRDAAELCVSKPAQQLARHQLQSFFWQDLIAVNMNKVVKKIDAVRQLCYLAERDLHNALQRKDGTDYVEEAAIFFVEKIVGLENVAVACSIHG